MTTHHKTKAFVFKKNDRNESDRVFSVFTDKFGRIDIFAKAIRKNISKLRSGIDIFFVSEIEFIQGKSRKTLTDASAVEMFKKVSLDLEKFKIANKVGEILDNFIKGEEKDEEIFTSLNETMRRLDGLTVQDTGRSLLFFYFLWDILSLLGYRPEVQKCNICQGKLDQFNVYFSDKLGGVICSGCVSHDNLAPKINSDVVKILRLIFKKEWATVSRLKIEMASRKMLQEISNSYYSYILSSHSYKNVLRVESEVV